MKPTKLVVNLESFQTEEMLTRILNKGGFRYSVEREKVIFFTIELNRDFICSLNQAFGDTT